MEVLIVIGLDGVQRAKTDCIPTSFDFAAKIISGGKINTRVSGLIAQLSLMSIFPDDKGTLFKWDSLRSNDAINYVVAHHAINSSLNANAIMMNKGFSHITDSEIVERTVRYGMLSPNEVESRFPSPPKVFFNKFF
jgi:hypothetical protein